MIVQINNFRVDLTNNPAKTKSQVCEVTGAVRTQVTRDEFLLYMLQDMNIVSKDDLDRITGVFDTLDVSFDRTLNLRDVLKPGAGIGIAVASTSSS